MRRSSSAMGNSVADYHFAGFVFDSRAHRLSGPGGEVLLRPKARLLLSFLLGHPGRIISKVELMEAVWGHSHIEDQALFQLISEIRLALDSKSCIQTFPNKGYQWAWPISSPRLSVSGPRHGWVAAVAVVAVVAILIGVKPVAVVPDKQPGATIGPATNALNRAIAFRAAGDFDRAERSLKVAITEYPRFALAKLELAEVLRLRGELISAQGLAYDALSDARLAADQYLEVTAHLSLSRLRWQQGDLAAAIELNSAAGKIARSNRFSCVAELATALDDLLVKALSDPDQRQPPSLLEQSLLTDCRSETWLNESPMQTADQLAGA